MSRASSSAFGCYVHPSASYERRPHIAQEPPSAMQTGRAYPPRSKHSEPGMRSTLDRSQQVLFAFTMLTAGCERLLGVDFDHAHPMHVVDGGGAGVDAGAFETMDASATPTGGTGATPDAPAATPAAALPADASAPDSGDSGPLDLALRTLGSDARAVNVAAGRSGHGIVVWEHWISANDVEVWANIYDPAVGWLDALRLSVQRERGEHDRYPAAVVDATGGATVVWMREEDVFARRYLAKQRTWSDEASVDATHEAAGVPSMTVDGDGNVMASWATAGSPKTGRYDASAARWLALGLVDGGQHPSSARAELTLLPGGEVLAIWMSHMNWMPPGQIWSSRYTAGTWQAPVLIHEEDAVTSPPGSLGMASNGAGDAIAIWNQLPQGEAYYQIWTKRFQAGTWAPRTLDRARDQAGPGTYPRIVAEPSGSFTALWTMRGLESRRSEGSTWSAPSLVGNGGNAADASEVQFAIDPGGNLAALWAEQVDAGADVAWSVARPEGAWAPIKVFGRKIGQAAQLKSVGHPRLATAATGSALVAWVEPTDTGTTIAFARWLSL
ncbi:MAG: hypothetical protein JWN04_6907 [Myxococcaceae bacterium]|nr:hypothetical protein [Myxococcaceae bacterium]